MRRNENPALQGLPAKDGGMPRRMRQLRPLARPEHAPAAAGPEYASYIKDKYTPRYYAKSRLKKIYME
jgi:hypothetical protein